MDTTFIYGLNDPETGECRYVGKSDNPKKAWYRHLRDGRTKTTHKANWVKSLDTRGLKPVLEILDEVPKSKLEWPSYECAYIEFFRELGCNLTNMLPGGEGGSLPGALSPRFGKPCAPETIAKISAALTGTKESPERAAKKIGRKASDKSCMLMRAKHLGSSSNFYGVSRCAERDNWVASIRVAGKRRNLGRFSDETEAAEVYDIAAKIHHGAYAVLNFPD